MLVLLALQLQIMQVAYGGRLSASPFIRKIRGDDSSFKLNGV